MELCRRDVWRNGLSRDDRYLAGHYVHVVEITAVDVVSTLYIHVF